MRRAGDGARNSRSQFKERNIAATVKNYRTNGRIKSAEVMLVPADGGAEDAGARVVPISVARAMAEEVGLDLVEVAPGSNPPVCRIMDYGKFRYIQLKKHKEVRKSGAVSNQTREVRMMPFIFENDLAAKVARIRSFLSEGIKVKVTVLLKGRMQQRPEVAEELLDKINEGLQGLALLNKGMLREGRTVSMLLSPDPKSDPNLMAEGTA